MANALVELLGDIANAIRIKMHNIGLVLQNK